MGIAQARPTTAASVQAFAASCIAGDAIGSFVYLSGSESVRTVDIDDLGKMPAVGIVISKGSPTTCVVQVTGEVDATGLTPGPQYVGTSSTPVGTRPANPGAGLRNIQFIGTAISATRLLLTVTPHLVRIRP